MKSKLSLIIILFFILFLITSCTENQQKAQTIEASVATEEITLEVEEEEDQVEIESINIVVDGEIGEDEYPNSYSDRATGLTLSWHNDDSNLYICIESSSTGWAAVGFDPDQAMKGANIIMVTIQEGNPVIKDDYGDSPFTHLADERLGGTSDIIDFAGIEKEEGFIFEFVIPLDSGDIYDKKLDPGNDYRVILAINTSSTDLGAKHTNRGGTVISIK